MPVWKRARTPPPVHDRSDVAIFRIVRADHIGVDRIFREVRISPERINRRLQKFFDAVQAHDLSGVKIINNS